MEGCWICAAGLSDARTRSEVTVRFCFNSTGRGTVGISSADGQKCRGQATARIQDRKLLIQMEETPCNSGDSYKAHTVVCSVGQQGKADCRIKPEGQQRWITAIFRHAR